MQSLYALIFSLSLLLPSCSVQFDQSQLKQVIEGVNSSDFNKLIDAQKNQDDTNSLSFNSQFDFVKIDSLSNNFNTLLGQNKLSLQLTDIVFLLDENGSLMALKQDDVISINDPNIKDVNVLCYPSEDMNNPFFIEIRVSGIELSHLALYARYIPSTNGAEAFYELYLVRVGNLILTEKF